MHYDTRVGEESNCFVSATDTIGQENFAIISTRISR